MIRLEQLAEKVGAWWAGVKPSTFWHHLAMVLNLSAAWLNAIYATSGVVLWLRPVNLLLVVFCVVTAYRERDRYVRFKEERAELDRRHQMLLAQLPRSYNLH